MKKILGIVCLLMFLSSSGKSENNGLYYWWDYTCPQLYIVMEVHLKAIVDDTLVNKRLGWTSHVYLRKYQHLIDDFVGPVVKRLNELECDK